MKRTLAVLAVLSASVLGGFVPSADAVPAPTRSISVTGTGVSTYPAFADGTLRYAATTTDATAGTLTVTATTADTHGSVLVAGHPVTGPTTVSGLSAGDEVSVIIKDSAGTAAYAVVYLPAGFPTLAATGGAGVQPGLIGMTMNTFGTPAAPAFEAIVDRNGVPTYVAPAAAATLDLKRQPNGQLSISRPTTLTGKTGTSLVTLGADLSETARYDTVGLKDTDSHDAERLADGSTVLTGYEPNAVTGKVDATIQKLNAAGVPVFTWTSAAFASETAAGTNVDYAHINSIQTVGEHADILASFRHFSSVFLIATEAHDGHQPGDVIWKLGGRDSTFDFAGDPHGGPCAQHTASMLPNGHVLVYDNGGSTVFANQPLCVDQADPHGPTLERPQTRAAEYALDLSGPTPTATLVWSYEPTGRYAYFAGSARRMDNGDTLIGWASERRTLATEVDADSHVLWELAVPGQSASSGYVTYRAEMLGDVPDAIRPTAVLTGPATGTSVRQDQVVPASYSCADRGGSTLKSCTVRGLSGSNVDTRTPGTRTVEVTATDGAGNTTTTTRTYTVLAAYGVDGGVWSAGAWKGFGIRGLATNQTVRLATHGRRGRVTGTVLVRNTGFRADNLALSGSKATRWFDVRYYVGSTDVTRRVTAGTYRSPRLAPNSTVRLRVVLVRKAGTANGRTVTAALRASSASSPATADRVSVVATARR